MPITGDKYSFTQDNVNKAPEVHGVYALYDGDLTIYIGRASGKSVTIRSRLQSHFRGAEGSCTQGASHYKREKTSRPIEREKKLIDDYYNANGKLPRCNDVKP